jgi:hypothetical protein
LAARDWPGSSPSRPTSAACAAAVSSWSLLGGVYALAGGAAILGVVLLVQAEGGSVNEYVGFVFSSSVSLLVALALSGAGALATLAFTDTADRAAAIGDVSLLAMFFWVGVAFLALYHVLWVVYVLVLTTIWPLKVVVPK